MAAMLRVAALLEGSRKLSMLKMKGVLKSSGSLSYLQDESSVLTA